MEEHSSPLSLQLLRGGEMGLYEVSLYVTLLGFWIGTVRVEEGLCVFGV